MKIQLDSAEVLETDALSTQEVMELKRELEVVVDQIEYQLDLAKAEQHASGEFADPIWFAKANFALKRKRKVAQELQGLLNERKRAEKNQGRFLSEYFMDVCRERMTAETFDKVFEEAERRRERVARAALALG